MFWNFPLDQISNVSSVMLSLVAEGWGKEVTCGNVPVKNNANCFLVQKAISIPFHGLGIAIFTLKPVKNVVIIYTSQNNKPLHHVVGSPMNLHYGGIVLA